MTRKGVHLSRYPLRRNTVKIIKCFNLLKCKVKNAKVKCLSFLNAVNNLTALYFRIIYLLSEISLQNFLHQAQYLPLAL